MRLFGGAQVSAWPQQKCCRAAQEVLPEQPCYQLPDAHQACQCLLASTSQVNQHRSTRKHPKVVLKVAMSPQDWTADRHLSPQNFVLSIGHRPGKTSVGGVLSRLLRIFHMSHALKTWSVHYDLVATQVIARSLKMVESFVLVGTTWPGENR